MLSKKNANFEMKDEMQQGAKAEEFELEKAD